MGAMQQITASSFHSSDKQKLQRSQTQYDQSVAWKWLDKHSSCFDVGEIER